MASRHVSGITSAVHKIFVGMAIFFVCFWGTLLLLDTDKQPPDADACPAGERAFLAKPYLLLEGHAYKAALPSLASLSDNEAQLFRSPVSLCEDKSVLGPAHSFHAEIAGVGFGRFSHYGDSIIFSSWDNSDPNSNGRQYLAIIPSKKR